MANEMIMDAIYSEFKNSIKELKMKMIDVFIKKAKESGFIIIECYINFDTSVSFDENDSFIFTKNSKFYNVKFSKNSGRKFSINNIDCKNFECFEENLNRSLKKMGAVSNDFYDYTIYMKNGKHDKQFIKDDLVFFDYRRKNKIEAILSNV